MTSIFVTKRSGETEPFNINKIHRVLDWACNDLVGVSVSEIEMRANVQVYEAMESVKIHDLLIKSSAELITEATPNYQTVAARLINYKLKKLVYGDKDPWPLIDIINHNIAAGVYDPDILNKYSEAEIDYINNNIVNHSRDDEFTYAGMEQMRSKYLVQNRTDGTLYETPQVLYIMIAMTLFAKYNGRRMKFIREFYNAISQFKIDTGSIIENSLMSYRQYLDTVYHSKFIISDSGTAQEEPAIFRTPVLVPRDYTERPQSYHTFCSRKLYLETLSISDEIISYIETAESTMNPKWLGEGSASKSIVDALRT